MSKNKILSNELKKELDAFFYQYSTKNIETSKKALSVLQYALDMVDQSDINQIKFELQSIDKLSNEYLQKIEYLREQEKIALLFELLDMFLEAMQEETNHITQDQIKEYIKTI